MLPDSLKAATAAIATDLPPPTLAAAAVLQVLPIQYLLSPQALSLLTCLWCCFAAAYLSLLVCSYKSVPIGMF